MSAGSFDRLFRGVLKGEIPPAIYLHGPEEVLKDELVREVLDRLLDPSLRDFNFDQRSAASLAPEDAETLLNTLPMMADRRVAVIRDVEAWNKRARAKQAVLRYLERPAPETVVILVQGGDAAPDKELAGSTASAVADRLPPERARKWLELEAGRQGVELEAEAAEHLVRVTDADLGVLKIELAKLSGLAEGRPLSVDLVGDLIGVRRGETQHDWRDLVLTGRTGRAIEVLPHVLAQSGVTGVSLVMLLGTSLLGIGLARAHLDRGAGGGRLEGAVKRSLFRARPARVSYDAAAREWSRLAPAWTRTRIDAAIRATLRADERLKSTTLTTEQGILVDLILQLANPARAAA